MLGLDILLDTAADIYCSYTTCRSQQRKVLIRQYDVPNAYLVYWRQQLKQSFRRGGILESREPEIKTDERGPRVFVFAFAFATVLAFPVFSFVRAAPNVLLARSLSSSCVHPPFSDTTGNQQNWLVLERRTRATGLQVRLRFRISGALVFDWAVTSVFLENLFPPLLLFMVLSSWASSTIDATGLGCHVCRHCSGTEAHATSRNPEWPTFTSCGLSDSTQQPTSCRYLATTAVIKY